MKKFLSLVLALIMVMSLVTVGAGAADFTDADTIEQKEAVAVLSGLGIVNGTAAGNFAPKGTLTRGAAAKIICISLLGDEMAAMLECDEAPFSDVAADSTFAPYIAYLAGEGIVNGYTDGTFKPKATLSGYAFAKMLLGALEIEGEYTGTNWKYNVAIAAGKAELLDGIDTLTGDIAREDACQLALNAIIYTPEGKSENYVVKSAAGKTLYKGTDANTALLMVLANDGATLDTETSYAGSWGDNNWNLKESKSTDDFGRISKTWTNGEKEDSDDYVEYAAIAEEAVLTYTASVKATAIKKALGYKESKYDTVTLNAIVNGAPAGEYKDAMSGNGTLVEVYETENEDVYTVIVVETNIVKLTDDTIFTADEVDEDEDEKPYILIEGVKYETEEFKKNNQVLYTAKVDAQGDVTKIVDVVKAKTVVGYCTAYADEYIRVDGEKYALSAANTAKIGSAAGYKIDDTTSYTYYLDSYGNIIRAVKKSAASVETAYLYVLETASKIVVNDVAGDSLFEDESEYVAVAQAKVIDLATGETSVKDIAVVQDEDDASKWYYAGTDGEATKVEVKGGKEALNLPEGIYEYTALEDGSIVLIGEADEDLVEVTVEKGVAKIATTTYANSATTLSVVTITKDSKGNVVSVAVKTSTGIANFPETAKEYNALITADDDTNIAESVVAIVVKTDTTKDTTDYAIYAGAGEVTGNGKAYNFYVGGETVSYIAKTGVELALTDEDKGTAYKVTLTSGKIAAAEDIEVVNAANGYAATVIAVDDTYALVKGGSKGETVYTVYFHEDGCAVYDADAKYAATKLAVDDIVWIYGSKSGQIYNDVDMIIVDND